MGRASGRPIPYFGTAQITIDAPLGRQTVPASFAPWVFAEALFVTALYAAGAGKAKSANKIATEASKR